MKRVTDTWELQKKVIHVSRKWREIEIRSSLKELELLKSKLNAKNIVQVHGSLQCGMGQLLFIWRRTTWKKKDRTTQKLFIMNGVFHLESTVNGIYLPRDLGGKVLLDVKSCLEKEEVVQPTTQSKAMKSCWHLHWKNWSLIERVFINLKG